MEQLLQYVLSGVTAGSIYAVVAIGFNIIYSTTGVLNFAQGEFVMLGGMTAVTLSRFVPVPVAIALAVLVVGGAGSLLEMTFFRPLRRHGTLHLVIITIGLAIVIREASLHIWDEHVRSLPYFTGSATTSIELFPDAFVSPQVLWVLGVVGVAVAAMQAGFRFTLLGRAMRACASNPDAALLAGINLSRMRSLAFGLSAALGALGGCVTSPITMTHYGMGADLAIKGFAAAVLGGLGNPSAAVLGGLLVGLLESLSVIFLPNAYKDATAFIVLIAMLLLRPRGLLGTATPSVREC